METTLIILKPDAVQRGLIGKIIARFEGKGLQIVAAKFAKIDPDLSSKHYQEHQGKPFYDGLIQFMTGSPVLLLAIRGHQAIQVSRRLMGATSCPNAEPGTIRGDLGLSGAMNLIHGSDSPESARRELALFFEDHEILDYDLATVGWINSPSEISGDE